MDPNQPNVTVALVKSDADRATEAMLLESVPTLRTLTDEAMAAALASTEAPILAYCRSGTRSTLLWALARASEGESPQALADAAAAAGYDVTPVRALLDMLAAGRS